MWDPETWQVTMTRAGHTVTMTPGETTARVDGALCVGCGRCAKVCPADVIDMVERGAGA